MKKALAGPAKRTAKKKPERRAMIAAARPAHTSALVDAASSRGVDRLLQRRAGAAAGRGGAARRAAVAVRLLAAGCARSARCSSAGLGRLERLLLRGAALGRRAATRASAVLTPWRAICLAVLAAAGCLVAAQFVDYRAVEVGPARLRGPAGGERADRRGRNGRDRRTPTCWSPSACSRRRWRWRRCATSAAAASAASSSRSACSASPWPCSSTCRPASTSAPKPLASPARGRSSTTASTPRSPPRPA